MAKRLYIGGICGCGKTTIVRIIQQRNLEISCLFGSKLMFGDILEADRGSLKLEDRNKLRDNAFKDFYNKEKIIAEGHFWLTEKDINFFDKFILIDMPEEFILELRCNDLVKNRSLNILDIRKEKEELIERVKSLEKYEIKIEIITGDKDIEYLYKKIMSIYNQDW